jgi:ferric-dicitrate binding protein FerR (iron transport regulator)
MPIDRAQDRTPVALTRRSALGGMLLIGASAAELVFHSALAAAAVAGYVQDVRGQVTAELATQRRTLAPRGDIFLGDEVISADRSRAALQLGRDTSLRLGANAQIRIDRFIVDAGGVLTLEAGPLLLDRAPGAAGALQIRGSFGLITIRGTRIFVGPSNGVIGIFVVHGLVDVTSGGRSVVLQTGEGTNVAAPGAPPTPPVKWGEGRIRAALASVD